MEVMNIIQNMLGIRYIPNGEKINYSIIRNIETNQNNIQDKIDKSNDQIKPPEKLNLNENERFNSNDRNNEIELIVPFPLIGKKRLRKIFKTSKKKRSSSLRE